MDNLQTQNQDLAGLIPEAPPETPEVDIFAGFDADVLDMVAIAPILNGEYLGNFVKVERKNSEYTKNGVTKTGDVYNIHWELPDGRILIDPRFIREGETKADQYRSLNIATGSIGAQFGKINYTLRDLLTEQPKGVKIWVSRHEATGNRNIDYMPPMTRKNASAPRTLAAAGTPVQDGDLPF